MLSSKHINICIILDLYIDSTSQRRWTNEWDGNLEKKKEEEEEENVTVSPKIAIYLYEW